MPKSSVNEPERVPAFTHVTADFDGVSASSLRDVSLLQGLLIAAAGAAGFGSAGAPLVKELPSDSIAAVLLLDGGCHMTVHTFPDRGLVLLDVLSTATHDARKALDVFARRLAPREIRSESRLRG